LEILSEHCGWRIVDDIKNATIVWLRHGDAKIDTDTLKFGNGQLFSLIEKTSYMTDKAKLHDLLKDINATHLQPETYYLGKYDECKQFFLSASQNPEIIWISKEPDNSQGDGIIVNPDFKTLQKDWLIDPESNKFDCKSNPNSVILQRYILNPLLLNGKKMEIRSYWLIGSLDPFLVYYHDGTVRLTTTDYTLNDWSNPLVHITNTKQQKSADPEYHLTEHERKWTLEQLGDYLQSKGTISNSEKWINEYLRPKLIHIISLVASAAWPRMMTHKGQVGWDGRFELLGMDVILDDQLTPWLTEIQMGPGLSRDRGIKEIILPKMIEELTDIVLEIDHNYRKYGKVGDITTKTWLKVPITV